MVLKLSLIQNALHSIEHGIEHLEAAIDDESLRQLARFDARDGSVSVSTQDGTISSYTDGSLTKLPQAYGLKFAILHLIHGVELLVKAHLEQNLPGSTVARRGAGRSIAMAAAVKRLANDRPGLLDPAHLEMLLRTREIRNQIEHAELHMPWAVARRTAVDFLSIANYLAFALHSIRLAEVFSFDPYHETSNRAGEALTLLLSETSPITVEMVQRVASEWAASKPVERLLLCFRCGARGLSRIEEKCVACGADDGLEIAIMADELDQAVEQMLKIRG